jgi:colicin import membrane protein
MKSIIPDPEQLDELAAGLDAGWDDEPAETRASQPPLPPSSPPNLDALDADWEVDSPVAADAPSALPEAAARNLPFRASKRERREAERKRLLHQAQQRSASKEQRKAERTAEARLAADRQRAAAEQQAQARQKQAKSRKRATLKGSPKSDVAANAKPATSPKRDVKRARREQTAPVRAAAEVAPSTPPKSAARRPAKGEGTLSKLIVPLVLATVFAFSLWFALSRSH